MFPNFQFQNKVLDLKYDPSFLVLQIQASLLITGFVSFFKPSSSSDTGSMTTQLVGTSSVLLLLALASFILKPCLIKKVNVWDVGGYSLAAWVNLCALVVVLLNNSYVAAIMLGSGSIVIIALTILVIKKYYSEKSKKRKTNLDVGYVTYDINKRRALVPDNDAENDEKSSPNTVRKRNFPDERPAVELAEDYYKDKKGHVF